MLSKYALSQSSGNEDSYFFPDSKLTQNLKNKRSIFKPV